VIRTKDKVRMDVEDLLYVLPVEENTSYDNHEEPFGEGGDPYFKLSFSSNLGFFPGTNVRTRPDGLLVKDYGGGNIWVKGFFRGDEVYISAQEQPWLMISGPQDYIFDLSGDVYTHFQARYNCFADDSYDRYIQVAKRFILCD